MKDTSFIGSPALTILLTIASLIALCQGDGEVKTTLRSTQLKWETRIFTEPRDNETGDYDGSIYYTERGPGPKFVAVRMKLEWLSVIKETLRGLQDEMRVSDFKFQERLERAEIVFPVEDVRMTSFHQALLLHYTSGKNEDEASHHDPFRREAELVGADSPVDGEMYQRHRGPVIVLDQADSGTARFDVTEFLRWFDDKRYSHMEFSIAVYGTVLPQKEKEKKEEEPQLLELTFKV